jgi:hypothetical protein
VNDYLKRDTLMISKRIWGQIADLKISIILPKFYSVWKKKKHPSKY